MKTFISIDIETANEDYTSICSVGLVRFENNCVAHQTKILINPEVGFAPKNVSIHGIDAKRVATALKLADAFPILIKHLRNQVIVHHTHFDRTALQQTAEKLGLEPIFCQWLDSAQVARTAWEKFEKRGYGLANLAREFELDFKHHDALEDARIAGLIFVRAMNDTGTNIDDWIKLENKSVLQTKALGFKFEVQLPVTC